MRTRGEPVWTSPTTRATASSVLALSDDARVAKPWIRKCPQRVGKSADATCFTFERVTIGLYRSNLPTSWMLSTARSTKAGRDEEDSEFDNLQVKISGGVFALPP